MEPVSIQKQANISQIRTLFMGFAQGLLLRCTKCC